MRTRKFNNVFILLFISSLIISSSVLAQNKYLKNFPKEADPYSIGKKLANHYLSGPYRHFDENPSPPPYIVYPETCTWFGALKFSNVAKDKQLLRRLEQRFYPLLGEQKELMQKPNHVDNTVFGVVPLQLYLQTGNECYYHIGIDFADRQWQMPKTVVQESNKKKYEDLLEQGLSWQTRFWIDDMYMISAVQTQAYLASGDKKYIERSAYEMTVYLDSIQRPNGLFYHEMSAPFFWCRGNGWMAAGMSELLKNLPKENKDRERIMQAYLKMMSTLKEYVNSEGLWCQLIDQPDTWTETSGSAMFVYAMVTGVKNGWLEAEEYAPIARKAWITLVSYLNENGDLRDVCQGTNIGKTKEHYMKRKRLTGDFHGQGAMLWCAAALLEK